MNEQRAASLIGIAQKAGKIASGEEQTVQAIRNGSAQLVVVASDASDNTKKKILDKAAWYKVQTARRWEMAELGRMIGKGDRACLALLDPGLAEKIKDHLDIDDERSVV